jgi:hypothetical protein
MNIHLFGKLCLGISILRGLKQQDCSDFLCCLWGARYSYHIQEALRLEYKPIIHHGSCNYLKMSDIIDSYLVKEARPAVSEKRSIGNNVVFRMMISGFRICNAEMEFYLLLRQQSRINHY